MRGKIIQLSKQLKETKSYLNDLVTFLKESDILEFCQGCDGYYLYDDGRQCECCPSCVGEDYDEDESCRDCRIEFAERYQ